MLRCCVRPISRQGAITSRRTPTSMTASRAMRRCGAASSRLHAYVAHPRAITCRGLTLEGCIASALTGGAAAERERASSRRRRCSKRATSVGPAVSHFPQRSGATSVCRSRFRLEFTDPLRSATAVEPGRPVCRARRDGGARVTSGVFGWVLCAWCGGRRDGAASGVRVDGTAAGAATRRRRRVAASLAACQRLRRRAPRGSVPVSLAWRRRNGGGETVR
mmetsp:Transcript_8159/g.28996  ORF Transcript_8159/g.28996 Transcript_8159/m.28996 type:complete len:220 (+) Transcript_8159:511-1170(+)